MSDKSLSGDTFPMLFLLYLALTLPRYGLGSDPAAQPPTEPQTVPATPPAGLETAPVVFDGDILYTVKGSLGTSPR